MTRKRGAQDVVRLRAGGGGKADDEGASDGGGLLELLDGLAAPGKGKKAGRAQKVTEAMRDLEEDENEARFLLQLEETTAFNALNILESGARKKFPRPGKSGMAAAAPTATTSGTSAPAPEPRRRRAKPKRLTDADGTPAAAPPPPHPPTAPAPSLATAPAASASSPPKVAFAPAPAPPAAPQTVPAAGAGAGVAGRLEKGGDTGSPTRRPNSASGPARSTSTGQRSPPSQPLDQPPSPRPQAPTTLRPEAAPQLEKVSASVRRAEECLPSQLESSSTLHPDQKATPFSQSGAALYQPPAAIAAEQEALAEPSLAELFAALQTERGRHWRQRAKKWHPALELDCDRGFGLEVTYRVAGQGQADARHALQFLRLLLSSGHMGWDVQEGPRHTDLRLVSPVLVGTEGLQDLCTVLWEMEAVGRVLPLTPHSLAVYVTAYDGLLERLQGLCLNYYLFEQGLGLLLAAGEGPSPGVVPLQRNARLGRLSIEEAMERLAQAASVGDLARLVNPRGLDRGCHAVDLSHVLGPPATGRWRGCLRFNARPTSFGWRQVQPWVMVLTLFVHNSFLEGDMHHRRRPAIAAKYAQRIRRAEVTPPVEICGDMFTMVVHHQDLYLICREMCRTGPRHQLRPFIGLLSCKDQAKRTSHSPQLTLFKSNESTGVSLDGSASASQSSVGHPLSFLKVSTTGKLLRHRRAIHASGAGGAGGGSGVGGSGGGGGGGGGGPPWAAMPQYQYDFDLLTLLHAGGPLAA